MQARLRSTTYLIPISTLPILAYGWVLQHHLLPSISLILQSFMGMMIVIYNACGTLIIDPHPARPATAQASLNIVRCTLAAASLAALQPLLDAVGVGWCFSIAAMVTGGTAVLCMVVVRIWGEWWRRERQNGHGGEEIV